MTVLLTLLGISAVLVIALVTTCALRASSTQRQIPAFSYPRNNEIASSKPISPRVERRQTPCSQFPVLCADGTYVWKDRRHQSVA